MKTFFVVEGHGVTPQLLDSLFVVAVSVSADVARCTLQGALTSPRDVSFLWSRGLRSSAAHLVNSTSLGAVTGSSRVISL